jgi:ectoine hydroxylase-related dioxygenase (phytanoyl-CoA dioxygenase family)
MQEMKAAVILSQQQIDFYHAEGYLVLDNLMPPSEIESLREIYDRLFEAQVGRASGEFFDLGGRDENLQPKIAQLMNPSKYASELKAAWQFKVNATAIARQLQGATSYFLQDLAICKPPKSQAQTLWHQDAAYNDAKFDYENLNFWIPLQPVTLDNGCMQFIPGSHRQKEILKHHRPDPVVEAVECLEVDLPRAVACPLPAGGATIHHARTLHFTGPNNSDQPRRAFILEYEVPPVRRAVPHRYPWNDNRRTLRAKQFNKLSVRAKNKLVNVGRRMRGLLQTSFAERARSSQSDA